MDILTNSSIIPYKRVFEALRELDSVVAKLDAGRPETFEAINRPAKGVPNLKEVIESLIRLQEETGRLMLQTLIFRYADEKTRGNSSPDEIELIAEKAGQIDPVEVQVYTVSRLPSDPLAEPVDDHTLMEATRKINQIMGKKSSKLYI